MPTPSSTRGSGDTGTTVVHIGHDERVIRQRYEVISIINDLLIGTWFLIGSIKVWVPAAAEGGAGRPRRRRCAVCRQAGATPSR